MSQQAQNILSSLLSTAIKPISNDDFEIVNESEYDAWCEETMLFLDECHTDGKITPAEFGIMEQALFE